MNNKKGGFIKLLSFAIVAVILVSVISFAVSGWQNMPRTNNSTSNTIIPSDSSTNIQTTQKFISLITGLEINEEEFNTPPIAYLINSDSTVYGLSCADLSIEFPTEQSSSRLLFYSTDSALWKIGSLAKTRSYIDFTAGILGIPYINAGFDNQNDKENYGDSLVSLNVLGNATSYYKDSNNIFTSNDMIKNILPHNYSSSYSLSPFLFGNKNNVGSTSANTVIIPYSTVNESEFYYSQETKEYTYYKSGKRVVDLLNGKSIEYKNLFILFADSTTYENSQGSELVLDTKNGGRGYYISEGRRIEIQWSVSADGRYKFICPDGLELNVNAGNSYITFYKSFLSSNIITN